MPEPNHRNENFRQPRRGRVLVLLALLAAAIVSLVVADAKWEWRDNLRRIIEGEEVPAFREAAWRDTRSVRETLQQRLMLADPLRELEDVATRRDLALLAIINAAGDSAISRGSADLHRLMETLSADVTWLEEIAYGLPPEHSAGGLQLLADLYRNERNGIESFPECRRFASALAFSAARSGLGPAETISRYRFYVAGSQRYRLNSAFAHLAMWEMAIIATQGLDPAWGELETLAWFQDNVRLPAQEYPHVAGRIASNTRSLFGVTVDTEEFYTIYRDAVEKGMATISADSGCSTAHSRAGYAAAAACANGVPAVVASDGEHAVCLVDVAGTWTGSGDIPAGARCSWPAWGHDSPDFLRLVAKVGRASEVAATMNASRLAEMGRFFISRGNRPQGQALLREAVKAQPLHYAAWRDYLAAGAPGSERERAAALFADYPAVQAALAPPAAQEATPAAQAR